MIDILGWQAYAIWHMLSGCMELGDCSWRLRGLESGVKSGELGFWGAGFPFGRLKTEVEVRWGVRHDSHLHSELRRTMFHYAIALKFLPELDSGGYVSSSAEFCTKF